MEPDFVDVGAPLSPAEAGMLEFELERRGIALKLRICERDGNGDRQAVQVAPFDLAAATAVREELIRAAPAPEPPQSSRSHRWRNGLIAAVLGLVGSARVVRLVRVPRGPLGAMIVLGSALVLFAIVAGVTPRD
ncbi:MAG: hypothetical protein ACHQ1G_03690 [Planctomycetota bacterium]